MNAHGVGGHGSERRGAFVRDAVIVAAIAAATFQSLRRTVADRYIVPSDSMQPTLYGDPQNGDIVLVDKLASARALQRYDLAVFRTPGEPKSHLVKRAIAFGDDAEHNCLDLRDGDLWLGPDPQHLAREVKDPFAARDLRVPWFVWPATGGDPFEQCIALPLGAKGTGAIALPSLGDADEVRAVLARRGGMLGDRWLASVRAIDVSYLDAFGQRRREGGGVTVEDCGCDGRIVLGAATELWCTLLLRPDTFAFRWQIRAGKVELLRNGVVVAEHAASPIQVGEVAGSRACRVEFGHLDGRLFFGVDQVVQWCEPRRAEWRTPDPPTAQPLPRNLLHLGVIGDGARVESFTLFRDLHWYRERMVGAPTATAPIVLEPGQVWLLGDNSFDSRDSRSFGAVPLTEFVGRPAAVLGPPARRRWLPR